MCIAIVTQAGKAVSNAVLETCAKSNRDGGGFAFIRDGKVEVRKGFMDVAAFIAAYDKALAEGGAEHAMLLHFRIATMGKVVRENCHPFIVGRGTGKGAMIHNGSFFYSTGYGGRDEEKSDTRIVAEQLRNNWTQEDVEASKEELGRTFGSYNKVAFLWEDGGYSILNEKQGVWEDGVWFSHRGFKPYGMSGPIAITKEVKNVSK